MKKKEEKRPLIGCFAAASNITGHLVDVDTVSHLFHKYNGIVFFDYATAGKWKYLFTQLTFDYFTFSFFNFFLSFLLASVSVHFATQAG